MERAGNDHKERICIIGGGPAGVSAAMYLQKKGYHQVEIYEKLNKVGGKAWSPRFEVNGESRAYEMGAIMYMSWSGLRESITTALRCAGCTGMRTGRKSSRLTLRRNFP